MPIFITKQQEVTSTSYVFCIYLMKRCDRPHLMLDPSKDKISSNVHSLIFPNKLITTSPFKVLKSNSYPSISVSKYDQNSFDGYERIG